MSLTDPVHVRATHSFYADLREPPDAVRVCRGLSCTLVGASALADRVRREQPCRGVYCLGFCDRSPALLTADGTVFTGARAERWPRSEPSGDAELAVDVRCVARAPVVTGRIAAGDFSSLTRARSAGVYQAIAEAFTAAPGQILRAVEGSGQRGRGGAGFPTGRKWRLCAAAAADTRYVVANGDEGDPGSFIDRVLLENDPHSVLEGLMLCAYAVGAAEGIVFIRSEYSHARLRMEQAIVEAREGGLLGPAVLGHDFSFDVRVVSGHGSYVCGEETALLNAIEGRRGEVRVRPPYPVQSGLHGKPTVINNIETLVSIPWIVRNGAAAYRRMGTADSPGTKAFCLNHGFARPGIVEAEFGLPLRELIETHGGGGRGGSRIAAVAIGGPMGSIVAPEGWDAAVDFTTLAQHGITLGHGGLVALSSAESPASLLVHWLEFMADESCGKCVPCREGSRRALALARTLAEPGTDARGRIAAELTDLLGCIEATSLCGFGQRIPVPAATLVPLALARRFAAGGGR